MSKVMHRRGRVSPPAGEVRSGADALPEAAFAAAASADPKSLQLCAQARRALEFAFDTECRDAALAGLVVAGVMPDSGVRRLRVWLRGPADMSEEMRSHILERLGVARGFLRAQIASAIHRKRTPELAFELLSGERTRP